ncbi:hypothetical protein IW261DRAFT_1596974 [Armillaria novae-zelandiae]|uniref:DUF1996 domain-containing protein n=1 Tax=Armillaria novae-zelandiae TaxID=153914 RepID=A0AA39U1B0_9AGAR|nr:hypothetical protein IW261DRAFT_1596974 [Armillaria novae-zelandiae]
MLSLLSLLLVAVGANAWFRLPCTLPLVQERLDPIQQPGSNPSQHVHTVHGGSNFAPSSTYQTMRQSQCTSCQVGQDLSNYWFPKLYFRDPKTGLFESVANGGLLIYYQNRGSMDVANGGTGLKAFPEGFRMITGDPRKRSFQYPTGLGTQAELAERAIAWICLRYTTSNPDYGGTGGFPTTDCEAGFQSRLHFPACWDGVNVDSSDHKSHVAFLSQLDNGDCPSTHPVGLMKLFYEITWNIHDFAGRWDANDGWPFVYGHSDPTGYGWHGDFQNGWDVDALQRAIDQCNNPDNDTINGVFTACSVFNIISANTANQCRINAVVNEDTEGTLAKLPGCNPLQKGPGDATIYTDAQCPF